MTDLPPSELPSDQQKGLLKQLLAVPSTLLGAIAFYTILPVPSTWRLKFDGIARWVPVIGLLIGALLGLIDAGLAGLGMGVSVRSAVIVATWIGITGGLHLDGAMDTADGLAVFDCKRRLEVMADSRAGAFGVMAAVVIVLLKTLALIDLGSHRWLILMFVAAWGRWGQLLAIAHYPYLRPGGKGALHKSAIRSTWEVVPTLLLLVAIGGSWAYWTGEWLIGTWLTVLGGAISILTGAWFNRKLGGHTGDTYGATVEWTETLMLVLLTPFL